MEELVCETGEVVYPKIEFKRITVLISNERGEVVEIINDTLEGKEFSKSLVTLTPEIVANMFGINIRELDFRRMLAVRKNYGFNLQLEYEKPRN